MKDQHIICFLAAARTLNISLAAQELRLSQQAVSRNIRQLEEELGFSLLHRRNDGVQLTEIGKRYFDHFYEFSRRIYDASALCAAAPGRIRIAWSEWIGRPPWLLERLESCAAAIPGAALELVSGTQGEIMQMHNLDIQLAAEHTAAYVQGGRRILLPETLPIYLAWGKYTRPESEADPLPHLECLGEKQDRDVIVSQLKMRYELLSLPPRPIVLLPNLSSVYAQVQLGGGVCFSPMNDFLRDRERFCAQELNWSVRLYAILRDGAPQAAEQLWEALGKGGDAS